MSINYYRARQRMASDDGLAPLWRAKVRREFERQAHELRLACAARKHERLLEQCRVEAEHEAVTRQRQYEARKQPRDHGDIAKEVNPSIPRQADVESTLRSRDNRRGIYPPRPVHLIG